MDSFKGTPGPWQVAGPCCDAVGTDFDNSWYKAICQRPERTGGKLTDEYNANMMLIAAAPDLLEALQEIVTYHFGKTATAPAYLKAQAAIAKALGK